MLPERNEERGIVTIGFLERKILRVPLKISFFCAKYFYYVTLRSAIRFTLSNFNEGMEHDADRFVGLANTF